MKKIICLIMAINCLLAASCDQEPPVRPPSLAHSVSFDHYITEIEGSYNGAPLSGFQRGKDNILSVDEMSDTLVSLFCASTWEQGRFDFSISHLLLLGKPYDVSFYEPAEQTINLWIDDIGHRSVQATVSGWIKRANYPTRMSLGLERFEYECELRINCSWDDDQTLSLTITGISSHLEFSR